MSWRSHSVEYLSDNLFFETLLSSTTSPSASIYILRPKSRLSQSYDTYFSSLQLHFSALQLSSALFSSSAHLPAHHGLNLQTITWYQSVMPLQPRLLADVLSVAEHAGLPC